MKRAKVSDLEYYRRGMWTCFLPNTPFGELAYNTMVEQIGNVGGGADILTIHERSVLAQLRAAGYTVSKLKRLKNPQSIDEILKELDQKQWY